MKKEIITLAEAVRRLGSDVTICLEPNNILQAKTKKDDEGNDKSSELWVFDPATGRSGRGDGKFFDCRYFDRGGWGQLGIYEEPGIELAEDTRVVGHVVVQTMIRDGQRLIRVRKAKGLRREIFEFKPSSYSKNELCSKENCRPSSVSEANPQRIDGDMLHFLLEEEFPVEEGMSVAEFVAKTTDGRSLNALAKVGLLAPVI